MLVLGEFIAVMLCTKENNMRTKKFLILRIILLAIIVLVMSCKSGQKKSTENVVADADTVAVVEVPTGPITIHIDDEMRPLYDTLRLGELIESYRLIPLSS